MKVCIIYGSESGNSERAVKAIAKSWQGSNFEIGEIMEGATAAVRGFAALAEQYDFLVVATSSNGEGDPPFNFHPFLKALYAADDAGEKPLTGCGFAVLGFGCSHFDTFQNCPRLTDKLLADLGAIRAVSREECDDSDEAHTAKAKAKWADAVLKVLQSGKIPSAHVGDWTDACTQNGATPRPVWKSTSASGAPENSSLSHFSAMTRSSWPRRAVRNQHHHAIEQASRR